MSNIATNLKWDAPRRVRVLNSAPDGLYIFPMLLGGFITLIGLIAAVIVGLDPGTAFELSWVIGFSIPAAISALCLGTCFYLDGWAIGEAKYRLKDATNYYNQLDAGNKEIAAPIMKRIDELSKNEDAHYEEIQKRLNVLSRLVTKQKQVAIEQIQSDDSDMSQAVAYLEDPTLNG